MNVLVFDSNVVYAKQVACTMGEHLKDAAVYLAHNTAVLQHRLSQRHYDLVVADISSTMDCEVAAGMLKEASKDTPIVVWSDVSTLSTIDLCKKCHATQVLKKEFSQAGMQEAVTKAFGSGHRLPVVVG